MFAAHGNAANPKMWIAIWNTSKMLPSTGYSVSLWQFLKRQLPFEGNNTREMWMWRFGSKPLIRDVFINSRRLYCNSTKRYEPINCQQKTSWIYWQFFRFVSVDLLWLLACEIVNHRCSPSAFPPTQCICVCLCAMAWAKIVSTATIFRDIEVKRNHKLRRL